MSNNQIQRKFFIDCGAYVGESIRLFQTRYPNSTDYKIISFEPNSNLTHKFMIPKKEKI